MTENEPDIPELTGAPLGTTGRELREAREDKGWDINSLSESLHLRPAVLIAIEEGDYREVPELFLKGYIRSYARLVGLEGDRLIRQLESELQPLRQEEADRQVESPIFHMEVKKRKKRRIAVWVLLVALLAVLVFGFVRFQSMGYDLGLNFGGETTDLENVETEELPDLAEVGMAPAAQTPEAAAEPEPVEKVEVDPAASEPPADEPGIQAAAEAEPESLPVAADAGALAESEAADEAVGGQPQQAQPETAVAPEPEVEVIDPAEAQEQVEAVVVASEPEPVAPVENLIQFTMAFDGDCWIEVRNGSGERVYAGLQSAGNRLSQSVKGPVSFVIGNIDGIESFTFDGEPVEIGEYPSRNGRSELTLGPNSSN